MPPLQQHIDRTKVDVLLVEYARVYHKYKCSTNEDIADELLSRMDKIRENLVTKILLEQADILRGEVEKITGYEPISESRDFMTTLDKPVMEECWKGSYLKRQDVLDLLKTNQE